MRTMTRWVMLAALALALTACGTGASVSVQQVRATADRAIREANFGVTTIGAVRPLVNTLPLDDVQKDEIGCGVSGILGHSADVPADQLAVAEQVCGKAIPAATESPLGLAATKLRDVGSCETLQGAVGEVSASLMPFVEKLEASESAPLRYAGLAIRTGMGLYVGGVTCG